MTPYFPTQVKICSITEKNKLRDMLIWRGGWDLIENKERRKAAKITFLRPSLCATKLDYQQNIRFKGFKFCQ